MAKNATKPVQIGSARTYTCPRCGLKFQSATPGDQQIINLHLVMHIEDRDERMKLLSEVMEGAAQQALFL